ncbi:hypothetical protein RV00_GL002065 [Enterococcus devriesei]|uniref:Uncharacterized protein n=1 Tax=Enterococcus devriesei TaxID=319970 RepID=A0A1L8SV32_9ENTE|nr:hypothetical protein RV00_GL002065 [Enterococcus devriesei]
MSENVYKGAELKKSLVLLRYFPYLFLYKNKNDRSDKPKNAENDHIS